MNPNNKDMYRAPAPVASLLIASCAIVGLAYWLGATWLQNPVLAIPGGLWGVAVVFALLRWGERPARNTWLDRLRARISFGLSYLRQQLPAIIQPLAAIPDRLASAARGAHDGWHNTEDPSLTISYGISELHAPARAHATPQRNSRPRVGIDLSNHLANRLMHTTGAKRVEWVTLREQGLRSQELCRIHRLDAVVHQQGETICIAPADTGPLEPIWDDWATPTTPISYASVFPMRTDAARVTIGDTTFADPVERDITATMIEAIVHLRHAPVRVAPHRALPPASAPMRHLASLIIDHEQTHASWSGYRAACRVLTAWLSVNPVEWSDEDILETLASCVRTLSDEPEVLLRASAVRFVLGDDASALQCIAEADTLLRSANTVCPESQLPFVQSELNMGGDDPLAFGRIAAGLCLCAATTSANELTFMRDDLLDEARFTEWLIGRDAERFVLMQVFRELQRGREGQTSTLFQAA